MNLSTPATRENILPSPASTLVRVFYGAARLSFGSLT
jgi:hypothetical protein